MSGIAPTPSVNYTGLSDISPSKFLSLYILVSGIFAGIFIVVSLFIFCKYCRSRSYYDGSYAEGSDWALKEGSIYFRNPPESAKVYFKPETEVVSHRLQRERIAGRRGSVERRGSLQVRYSVADPHTEGHCDGDEAGRIRVSISTWATDDNGKTIKPIVYLQRQVSTRGVEAVAPSWQDAPLTDGERSECEVNVEVHPGPALLIDSREGGGREGVEGSVSSRTSSSRRGSNSPSGVSPPSLVVVHHHSTDKAHCPISPVGVEVDWDTEDSAPEQAPHRTPSTDWTMLESNLDYWRREHARPRPVTSEEDEVRESKVRYNDTGSLEEVNMENLIEYYVEDDEEIVLLTEEERGNLRLQYRRLWELRATLEEDEELTDPCRVNKKSKQQKGQSKKLQTSSQKQKPAQREAKIPKQHSEVRPQNKSSSDQSPEPDAITSHTTSFESNTEPCADDSGVSWHLLQLPSYESRRQTYKNILSWRLRRMEAKGNRQPSQEDTSFDSVDTEGSSTDASRIEQATTSFESTTDNTDSTGGTDGQAHRLQQLRADSGYRSIENPAPAPKLSHRQLPLGDSSDLDGPQRLLSPEESDPDNTFAAQRKHQINLGDSSEVEQATVPVSHRHPSLGDSGDLENPPSSAQHSDDNRHTWATDTMEPEDGLASLHSPTGFEPEMWQGRRRSCGRSASKKRREFSRTLADVDDSVLHRRCHSLRNYPSMYYTRDYSVDEKSDALFREFSRCEPWSVDSPRLVTTPSNYSRLQYRYQSYPYPEHGHKLSSMTRASIHEEMSPTQRYATDESETATVPIIQVADEDSSDPLEGGGDRPF